MHLDPWVIVAGLGVGFVVGLTGMGGGALMTPVLVIVFGIQPLAAVSSDPSLSERQKQVLLEIYRSFQQDDREDAAG